MKSQTVATIIFFLLALVTAGADKRNDESMAAIREVQSLSNIWADGSPGFRMEAQLKLYGMKAGTVNLTFVERWQSNKLFLKEIKGSDYEFTKANSDGKSWEYATVRPTPLRVREFEKAIGAISEFPSVRLADDKVSIVRSSYRPKKIKVDGIALPCFEQDNGQWSVCFDAERKQTRTVFESVWRFDYLDYTTFHGKSFPTTIKVYEGRVLVIDAVVRLTDEEHLDPSLMAPRAGAVLRASCSPPTLDLGKILERQAPEYPAAARALHESGTVRIVAVISETGIVDGPVVISAPSSSLADSAMEAVRKWKYSPYKLCGQPIEIETEIIVNFSPGR